MSNTMIKQKRVSFTTYLDADKPNKIQKAQVRLNMVATEKNESLTSMADIVNTALEDYFIKHKIK